MRSLLYAILLSVVVAGCSTTDTRIARINQAIESLKAEYAPDPRTAVFNVAAIDSNRSVILRGETDNLEAKSALLSQVARLVTAHVIDSVALLPESSLGDSIFGIVDVSVGNVYHAPSYQSEMVCQLLLGHTVKVLRKHHGWLFVQSADKYLGWAQPGINVRIDAPRLAQYTSERKLIVTAINTTLGSEPSGNGATISDAVMADLLLPIGEVGPSFKVRFPDGRIGYVPRKDVEYQDVYTARHKPTPEGIERVAVKMVGFPYLWGGTSTKGVDCSGFTKTVFRMNGIRLPRDASQQVNVGQKVEPGPNFENLRKGDLLFFGTKAENGKPAKIVHVAIYLGGGYFIQSADRVEINGLVEGDSAFDQFELNRFVEARRILPSK